MVKKSLCLLKKVLCCLLVLLPTIFSDVDIQGYASEIGIVKTLGAASANAENAEKLALEDARKKAVNKAVSRIISQNQNGQSAGDSIKNNYQAYVAGKIKVVRKQTVNGKLVLACDVPIDYEKMVKDVHNVIASGQNQKLDETVVFFVRFNGFKDKLKNVNFADDVFGKYNAAFRVYGFQVEDLDVGDYNDNSLSYEGLKNNLFVQVNQKKTLAKYVVISDVQLRKSRQNETSAFAEVDISSDLFLKDGSNYTVIGTFKNTFSGTRKLEIGAIDVALQRAVVNSAKSLADSAYQNWQISH